MFFGKYKHLVEEYAVTCVHIYEERWYWQLDSGSKLDYCFFIISFGVLVCGFAFYSRVKHLHEHVISLRGDVNLAP